MDINLLLVIPFANVFSHSVGCLLVLLMVSLAVQKPLSRSHLLLCFSRRIQKHVVIYVKVLHIFSSRSFLVSSVTFRSLIHFDCIFVCGARECPNLTLLHVIVQFSHHHSLKRLSFLYSIDLLLLSQMDMKKYIYTYI